MNENIVDKLKALTDVDFERDSAETECEHSSLRSLLTQFMEQEARSCSMDPGCITPLYVYRMWGGSVALEDIEATMAEIKFPGR